MFELIFYQSLLLALVYVHLTIVSYEIYLHRGIIHNTIKFSKPGALIFELWLWLAVSLPNKYYLCSHRIHHAYADTKLDPHGPAALGLRQQFLTKPLKQIVGHLGRAVLLVSKQPEYPPTELQKKFLKNIDDYQHSVLLQISKYGNFSFLLINTVLFGWSGIVAYVCFVVLLSMTQHILLDGFGHYFGYKNYQTNDNSKNIFPIGLVLGGTELHNNHHKYPGAARLDMKWYEFDIAWWYIKLLMFFKMCK